MAANGEFYENEFPHEGTIEGILSEEQNPLHPNQVVQYGE
jgi:hypothetical protein